MVSVSIIMPTKNRPELARRAVSSVMSQSVNDWELIILDDSSQDNWERIHQLQVDERIRFTPRPANSSVAQARTLGLDEAKGHFFTFLDSDDYYSPNRLEKHLNVWSKANRHLGFSWDIFVEEGGNSQGNFQPFCPGLVPRPRVARKMFEANFIHASAGFAKTDFAKTVDFSWNIFSDWLLFMRLGEKYDGYFIDEPLTFRDLSAPDRVSNQYEKNFFYSQSLSLRRKLVRSNPRVYLLPWISRDLSRLRSRVERRDS